MAKFAYQHLCATNDSNGNPRRVYAIYELENGNTVKVFDEGYTGRSEMHKWAEDRDVKLVELPPMNVTPAEYRAWRKAYP